jgi:6-phosphogluconolactonase
MRALALPEIRRHRDAAELAAAGAALVAARLTEAIAARGRASLVLSGGSTPQPLHRALTGCAVDWAAVHVYFGDERCVPPDDPASNYRMAREALLDRLPAPPAAVHRIAGELNPAAAASAYGERIAAAEPLDVLMLGMGDDGHTASLFPDTPEPPSGALVITTTSPAGPRHRVTLTYAAIQSARVVLLLVSGAAKAARLAEVHAQLRAGRPVLPAARIGPATWLVDEAAAKEIDR